MPFTEHQLSLPLIEVEELPLPGLELNRLNLEPDLYFGRYFAEALAKRSARVETEILARQGRAGVEVLCTGISDTRTLVRNPALMFATSD